MTTATIEILLVAELGEIKLSHLCLIAESESSSELASKCEPYPVLETDDTLQLLSAVRVIYYN